MQPTDRSIPSTPSPRAQGRTQVDAAAYKWKPPSPTQKQEQHRAALISAIALDRLVLEPHSYVPLDAPCDNDASVPVFTGKRLLPGRL